MREWLDVDLDLDDDALEERWDGQIVADERLRVLARENRLSLWRSDPERVDVGDGTSAVSLGLRCVAHAHPDCRFRWVRVNVDFSAAGGVQVADMSPRDEIASTPVKLTTRWSGGLSFEIASIPVGPESSVERIREQDVFLPRVTASGPSLRYALWDFTAVGQEPLHVDRDLRLLLAVPTTADAVPVAITLRGNVSAYGVAGAVPLVGRRSSAITVRQELTST
ncbi:hypothetical protein O7635_19070 [Asanoa sp. WMMD1127]|uniref:hypothetical protein n=1 Tax=Asanoa sp. WMMD1127 TaxID=3016107 RepID=UPI002417CF50|nr:hypothetical protein [Asanoa sp. WMMD1127]MDG4823964.1 hypothetical protein [Asanoa sp. WMMD1127]